MHDHECRSILRISGNRQTPLQDRFVDFCKKVEKIKNQNSRLSGLTSKLTAAKLLVFSEKTFPE